MLLEVKMNISMPAELLELKTRFDQWRATRQYKREPIPAELRKAAIEMIRRHPRALIRLALKLDPSRLQGQVVKQSVRKPHRKHTQPAFFKLPAAATLPESALPSQSTCLYRLQLERPDGTRLTITIPGADAASLYRLCTDFLRG
jgi:hypothetical protein